MLASSDGHGVLTEHVGLRTQESAGHYRDGDRLIGYARTPGYETYEGLGWHGVITVG